MHNPNPALGIDRFFAAFSMLGAMPTPQPTYSLTVLAERAQLEMDIAKSQRFLERLRVQDEPTQRKALVRELVTLTFAASLAVESGCPDERLDVVLKHLNLFTQAFDELRDIKGDIALAAMEIEDAQRTLADAALWREGGAA